MNSPRRQPTATAYAWGIMAGTHSHHETTLITSARPSRTLDVETRTRRYLITMTVRTACFLAFLVVPGWWKVVALVGALVLPLIAVLFANNSDHRPPPTEQDVDEPTRPALPAGPVIQGDVEDDMEDDE